MICNSSKFLFVSFLTFIVGVGTVLVWQFSINSYNQTASCNFSVSTKIIEFQKSSYQQRQWSCKEIKNFGGGFAPIKHTVNLGVLNPKSCMKEPSYPLEAIENKVDGQVNIEVLVDGFGKVRLAKAVTGNPILWKSAIEAAYKTQVCPTLLGGEPMNVKGILVYRFVLPN